MKLNLTTIKNMLQTAEELQKTLEDAKVFVLGLDVNKITIQEYQQALKYLVDILNLFNKQLEE